MLNVINVIPTGLIKGFPQPVSVAIKILLFMRVHLAMNASLATRSMLGRLPNLPSHILSRGWRRVEMESTMVGHPVGNVTHLQCLNQTVTLAIRVVLKEERVAREATTING